jgi:hypothetical protein
MFFPRSCLTLHNRLCARAAARVKVYPTNAPRVASSSVRLCHKYRQSSDFFPFINTGKYFCSICNFWDHRLERSYFHCHGCGMCRVGGQEKYTESHLPLAPALPYCRHMPSGSFIVTNAGTVSAANLYKTARTFINLAGSFVCLEF